MKGIDHLIHKLEQFIRKYYTNKLIRGVIYTLGLLLSFFLFILLIDYFGQFKSSGRTILFYAFTLTGVGVFAFNIVWPLLQLGKIGKSLSHEDAAKMVGDHFGDVKDKILNTLQLYKANESIQSAQLELVTASINQRIEQLRPLPFTAAIDIGENKKYLKYLAIPILLFLGIYLVNSKIITDGTERFVNYSNTAIDEEAVPFSFVINNNELSVIEQEDFELIVTIDDKKYAPETVYITVDGVEHKMKKLGAKEFSYEFRNVQQNQDFVISAQSVTSDEYTLKTIPKPSLLGFDIELNYPAYTQLANEKLKNIGDLVLPEGTQAIWKFNTKNTTNIAFHLADSLLMLEPKGLNTFETGKQFFENTSYSISTSNEFAAGKDSIQYFVTVTKDQYPSIQVGEKMDSANSFVHYFNGDISDDYGFSKLNFHYQIIDEKGKVKESHVDPLSVSKDFNSDQFFHFIDLSTLGLEPGETVTYFFQVWDNDGINGSKSTKSISKQYKAPTLEQLMDQSDQASEEIKDDLEKSMDEAEKLKQELNDIKKSLLEKDKPDWQDKNKIEQFLQNQQSLQQNIEKLQQNNLENQKQNNQFNQQSQEILEKQEMLNKLFDELMSDEMKELYKELQKLMEQMNKDQLLNKIDDIEMSQEEINKELDRALEQFKQFEFEQKHEEITKQLDELAKKQEELAEETKNKEKSNFDLNKEQEEIDKQFEKLQQEIDELEKLNEELEQPNDMADTEQDEQEINEEMKNSQEQLGDKKNKKASESQQNASDKMKEMSQKMKDSQAQSEAQSAQEDLDSLRQLLENLIDFSFEQEHVMDQFLGLNSRDPKYVKLGQDQRKLNDDAQLLEDSLFALSKRVLQLSPFINKEVAAMNANLEQTMKYITERQTAMTMAKQQYVMTAVNNLALLFDEAIKQMQQQMANSKPGSGQCNKPGGSGSPGGKPSPMSMKQMQKQLEEQMKKMKEAMEKGKNPGGKKDGEQEGDGMGSKPGSGQKPGGPGGQQMSKELAQMAAQQEALRKQIQQLSQELNQDGSGAGNGLKEIAKEMEEVEEDIINGKITDQTLMRQKQIMTRLLEHEKATREQDMDEKRKSNEAINQEFSNPTEYLKYKEEKAKELELLKTIPPSLKPYYKNKVNQYFEQIDR
ncbi:DUF4175 family protein [Parvicella tangerina]|uniref:Chromosome partition protein Smc n=1 Tax=Parvicella tangerina TaxID=2829795 RepID=A0A916JRK4_9FLAO|nr:DUF4175 family protein [Parvicella tangerina]CAG5086132.1 Chromosome partition protein Smc [Parvicella tangerina]